jgi:hypothetical protein
MESRSGVFILFSQDQKTLEPTEPVHQGINQGPTSLLSLSPYWGALLSLTPHCLSGIVQAGESWLIISVYGEVVAIFMKHKSCIPS